MSTGPVFDLEVSRLPGSHVVRASGRLVVGDGADTPEWPGAEAFGPVEKVVLDLGGVTAIDAGGIGRLVAFRQLLARRGARLTIGSASPRVLRVLQLTALDAVFGIASGRASGRRDPFRPCTAGLHRCA